MKKLLYVFASLILAFNGMAQTPDLNNPIVGCQVTSSLPSGNFHTCITSQAPSMSAITLTASGGANYTWSPATGLSATTGTSVVVNPTVTTTYTLTGVGCTTPVKVTVVVYKPAGTLTASNLNPCQGTPVDFTVVGSNVSQYSWMITPSTLNNGNPNPFDTGVTPSTSNTRTLQTNGGSNGINPGLYGVQVIAYEPEYDKDPNDVNGNGQCIDYNATPLDITIRKTYVDIKSSSNRICVGDVVTLTATGAATYQWSPASGLSATTGAVVSFTATQAMVGGVVPYGVTGTDAYGCTGSFLANTLDAPILANPTVSVTPSNPNICPGSDPVQLTASGANTYAWSPATGLSATTGATVTATPTTTSTYTVTGTALNGCKGTATAQVTVGNPTVTLTPNTTQPVCQGQNVSINSVVTGGTPTDYTWYITPSTLANGSPNPQNGATSPQLVFNTANLAPGDYKIEQSVLVSPCFANSNTITLTVLASPDVTLQASQKNYCVGEVVKLTASGADTYSWTPSTGLSATTGASVFFTLNSATPPAYQVTGTNTSTGCTATVTLASLGLVYKSAPSVTMRDLASKCSNGGVSLTVTGNATTYVWSPATGLNTTTGATVISTATEEIRYEVTGTGSNGCRSSATVLVSIDRSLDPVFRSITYDCETKAFTIRTDRSDPRQYDYIVNTTGFGSNNVVGPITSPTYTSPVTITIKSNIAPNLGCTTSQRVDLPSCGPLPVRWLGSSVLLNSDNAVEVGWTTSDETNNAGFEVERSQNGTNPERIGFVPPAKSSGQNEYHFIDAAPYPGMSYYRVKQLDTDGRYDYTKWMSVINEMGIGAFPNPLEKQLTITMPDGLTGKARLLDGNGRLLRVIPLSQMQQTVSMEAATSGFYLLEILDEAGNLLRVQKLIRK